MVSSVSRRRSVSPAQPGGSVSRRRFILPLLFLLLLCTGVRAQTQLQYVAQKGDGIYALLRKYDLLDYPCNLTEFYRLNGLKNNASLFVGRTYELPIQTVNFNGKSIRTSTGNDNYARALGIQHYNEGLTEKGARPVDFRKDKVLYIPFHIDNCLEDKRSEPQEEITDIGEVTRSDATRVTPEGPAPEQITQSDYRTFNIFGPKYAYVPKVDNKLAGRVFYILSGHGGPDPGAVGKRAGNRIPEDEYAYDVALRLTRNILAHGGTPYMIVRDDNDGIRDQRYLKIDRDETVWGGASLPLNQKARLTQRTDIVNQLYDQNLAKGITDQTMISIHVDSRAKSKRIDLYFYHHENDLLGAKQAERMQAAVRAAYARTRQGRGYAGTIGTRDLHVLRETKVPSVFIELGNMANASDQIRIIEPRNRQLMADWLVEGLF